MPGYVTTAVPPAARPSTERVHALDAVRAGALLLGVAFHASMSFLPGPQIWVVRDMPSDLLGGFLLVSHIFRMTLFFVIAGFFARMLLQRQGVGGFVRSRAKRILAPLLVFWPIVMAGIIASFVFGAIAMNGGTPPTDTPPPPPLTLATFPLTHLWFLYMLILLYAAALLLRAAVMLVDRSGPRSNGVLDAGLRLAVQVRIAPLLLAAPLAFVLASDPGWIIWFGIPTPDKGFVPNAAAAVGFGTAFGFGWLLQRQSGLLGAMEKMWLPQLVAALGLSALCLWFSGAAHAIAPPPQGVGRLLQASCYALAAWTWTFGLIGAALRFLSAERPAVRYVSDASYWIYLVHLPVVAALQVLVYPLAAPALVKFALVVAAAFLLLFASYHVLVRHSWIGAWLNGRKRSWRKAEDSQLAAA